jgi:hypothetical protein
LIDQSGLATIGHAKNAYFENFRIGWHLGLLKEKVLMFGY